MNSEGSLTGGPPGPRGRGLWRLWVWRWSGPPCPVGGWRTTWWMDHGYYMNGPFWVYSFLRELLNFPGGLQCSFCVCGQVSGEHPVGVRWHYQHILTRVSFSFLLILRIYLTFCLSRGKCEIWREMKNRIHSWLGLSLEHYVWILKLVCLFVRMIYYSVYRLGSGLLCKQSDRFGCQNLPIDRTYHECRRLIALIWFCNVLYVEPNCYFQGLSCPSLLMLLTCTGTQKATLEYVWRAELI